MSTKIVVWLFLLLSAWGASYPLVKLLSVFVSPIIIVSFRLFVAAVFFLALGRGLSVGLKQFINGVIYFVLFMLLLNVGTSLSSSPGLAAVMIFTQPLFVLLLERFLGVTFSIRTLVGVLVGFAGVFASAASTRFDLGIVLALFGGFAWAIGTVHYSHNLVGEDIVKLNAFTAISSLPLVLALTPLDYYFSLNIKVLILLIVLGISAQAFGYYLWFNLIRELGSVKASAASLLTPVAAYALSYLMLHVVPTIRELAGSAITLVGVYMALTGKARVANKEQKRNKAEVLPKAEIPKRIEKRAKKFNSTQAEHNDQT